MRGSPRDNSKEGFRLGLQSALGKEAREAASRVGLRDCKLSGTSSAASTIRGCRTRCQNHCPGGVIKAGWAGNGLELRGRGNGPSANMASTGTALDVRQNYASWRLNTISRA